jgi:hypothetical protein
LVDKGRTQALVRQTLGDVDYVTNEEELLTIEDLDRLFDACVDRWPIGWDLNKLLTCIRECGFD